jgi:formate dehydrogenase subunit gamma
VSEPNDTLRDAVARELEATHRLPAGEAAERAARMEDRVRPRFATWVRRELSIQRRREKAAATHAEHGEAAVATTGEVFERLSLELRLQHALMAISVIFLVLTGLPLKFHENGWAKPIIAFFGGPDFSPIVHRIAASGLIIAGLWHLAFIIVTREGRKTFLQLIPMPQDAKDAWQQIKYYLGRTGDRPRYDRFSYVEKFDYWAVYWGMVIMIGSGVMLWFTEFFLRHIPKWVTDIAKEAHSDEALLATLAIIIWHFYNVHLNPHKFPINKTFITGKISEHEMIEEHPLEYERIMTERRRKTAGDGGES